MSPGKNMDVKKIKSEVMRMASVFPGDIFLTGIFLTTSFTPVSIGGWCRLRSTTGNLAVLLLPL